MKKNRTTHRMAKLYMLGFMLVFMIIFGRFAYIQATGEIEGVSLQDWADQKRTSSYTIEADRGKIIDRNGMTLAYDRPTYSVYAIIDEEYSKDSKEPLHVENPEKTAEQLAPILGLEESYVYERLTKEKPFQVEFGANGRYLSQETREKIEELDLPGIRFKQQAKRYYPNGMFASHVLGFAQNQGDDEEINGMMGIEEQMDDYLSETNGSISYKRDKYNMKLLNPEEVFEKPEDGANVTLTIDQKIQTFLEDAMNHVVKEYSPEKITAIVMDPKTGEVLAMGNRPSFNPNERQDIGNWYNDVIASPYEPGSTMKIFTYAAAMEAGVYNGSDTYMSGEYVYNDRGDKIGDHNGGKGWDVIDYDEGFERSSNVAAAKLVWEQLGPETYMDYLQAFGLDQKTGIDLPGEQAGQIVYKWDSEIITTSFGQGSTFTPIQQMKAATSVANNGKMMQPYVVSQVTDPSSGDVLEKKEPKVAGEPISEDTAKEMRELMGNVVTGEHGTGVNFYNLANYSVAGKTGTAQIPNPNGGGYLAGHGNYYLSFLGMAPKEDPELMMYVSVKQPDLEATEYEAEPSSYIFKTVMENSLHYMNIKPTENKEELSVESKSLNDYTGDSIDKAKQALTKDGLTPIILGDGSEVKEMFPRGGTKVISNEKIFLVTSDSTKMPDMSGWALRDVLTFGDVMDISVDSIGSGFVRKQSVAPGASIQNGGYLVVELTGPNEEPSDKSLEEQTERSMQQKEEQGSSQEAKEEENSSDEEQ
ncbi:penicillin-binding protein [Pontibacillus chungwhensis BH030062]|uniref:serine-type D-Ala-D-Ala carboxypeptidase n=1 Tax=Pontibacillus chungwhensis BH030062 TaxID=1385513 RepID=A0A0A2UWV3_9BACI|nr:penicillin-binding protein [Pontibacillus chungwhensis]KGP92767.1 penicillin-binding protein [Pontibacillus chungwhensis BH030062]